MACYQLKEGAESQGVLADNVHNSFGEPSMKENREIGSYLEEYMGQEKVLVLLILGWDILELGGDGF